MCFEPISRPTIWTLPRGFLGPISTITGEMCSKPSHTLHSKRLSQAHYLYPVLPLSASLFLGSREWQSSPNESNQSAQNKGSLSRYLDMGYKAKPKDSEN